jgi:hypothetical protein
MKMQTLNSVWCGFRSVVTGSTPARTGYNADKNIINAGVLVHLHTSNDFSAKICSMPFKRCGILTVKSE